MKTNYPQIYVYSPSGHLLGWHREPIARVRKLYGKTGDGKDFIYRVRVSPYPPKFVAA